jgi:hypothetical protein
MVNIHQSLFISHAEADKFLIRHLVDLLLNSMDIEKSYINATSVIKENIKPGDDLSETILNEIQSSSVIICVLSPTSLQSSWVMFELGASWCLHKNIITLLVGDLTARDLPDLLKDKKAIHFDCDKAELDGMLKKVAELVNVRLKDKEKRDKHIKKYYEQIRGFKQNPPLLENEFRYLGNPADGTQAVLKKIKTAKNVLHVSVSPKISQKSVTTGYDNALLRLLARRPIHFIYIANEDDERRRKKCCRLLKADLKDLEVYMIKSTADIPRFNYWVIDMEYVMMSLRVNEGDDRFYEVKSTALAEAMHDMAMKAIRMGPTTLDQLIGRV